MEGINKVVILGAEEGTKIASLLSKSGLKVILSEEVYPKELADTDLVLEALPGLELKKEVLRKCDESAPLNAILATTASWGITKIAAVTKRPERVIGLNFTFNPFQESCLAQIVRGLETSEETVEACRSLVEKTGAVPVAVEDSPGLILDRVMASVINEAAIMYATKVATIEDIDRTTKSCLNWPMGPFEFADTIGIDNVLTTLEVLSQEEGPQFLPCRLLRQMVAIGRLGKKTGRGFYAYS
jgi:3-hydroxybutyryl-CoA dehydrogenase